MTAPIGGGLRGSLSLDFRDRKDGQRYTLVAARIARRVGRLDLFLDATNLLNESYTEVAGVPMPGRWLTAGVIIR